MSALFVYSQIVQIIFTIGKGHQLSTKYALPRKAVAQDEIGCFGETESPPEDLDTADLPTRVEAAPLMRCGQTSPELSLMAKQVGDMADRAPQTVVAGAIPAGPVRSRAPLSAAAGGEVEVPRSAQKLIAGLVNYFLRMNPPMNYDLASNNIEVETILADEGPGHYIYYSATPGMLHIFTPVGPTVPAGEDDDQVVAYLDGLTQTLPVPRVFEPVARYEMRTDTRELGLYITLPMPRTFSASAVSDALWLIDWLLREIESQAQE